MELETHKFAKQYKDLLTQLKTNDTKNNIISIMYKICAGALQPKVVFNTDGWMYNKEVLYNKLIRMFTQILKVNTDEQIVGNLLTLNVKTTETSVQSPKAHHREYKWWEKTFKTSPITSVENIRKQLLQRHVKQLLKEKGTYSRIFFNQRGLPRETSEDLISASFRFIG